MAGIRAGKGLKVSNFEFTAISDEFPSPLSIFRECEKNARRLLALRRRVESGHYQGPPRFPSTSIYLPRPPAFLGDVRDLLAFLEDVLDLLAFLEDVLELLDVDAISVSVLACKPIEVNFSVVVCSPLS